jgi:protein-L-isoaspartate O-methyltransferase
VNRADFIPDVIWAREDNGWRVPVNRRDDPERWQRLVDTDDAIITQVDDGNLLGDGKGFQPTSSSSGLDVMALMLDLLRPGPGMNILEIGAGTGYNAALIAQKVAPGHVTTMELDTGIAAHARTTLSRTGLPVTVITGDGTLGHPANAPYDGVICTASALHVPYAWVEQCRPGARIVLPFASSFGPAAFLCLTVGDDGRAHGRFKGGAAFMRLRNQRGDKPLWEIWALKNAEITMTRAYHPDAFTDFDTMFAISSRFPGWRAGATPEDDGPILVMSHFQSGSWATVFPAKDGAEHKVAHQGPRHLWDEVDTAWRWWLDAGRPAHTRFGLTVAPTGQTFWLDSPDNPLPPIRRTAHLTRDAPRAHPR